MYLANIGQSIDDTFVGSKAGQSYASGYTAQNYDMNEQNSSAVWQG